MFSVENFVRKIAFLKMLAGTVAFLIGAAGGIALSIGRATIEIDRDLFFVLLLFGLCMPIAWTSIPWENRSVWEKIEGGASLCSSDCLERVDLDYKFPPINMGIFAGLLLLSYVYV